MKLFIGLMSGTSMDGIDAALVDLDSNQLIEGITRPYSKEARDAINQVLAGHHPLGTYSQLNSLLGREFAEAVLQLLQRVKIKPAVIEAIGSHGQTLCHNTMAAIPYTVQLGCAHTIAELTGITVVADFRTRDLIVGGQGAPFAPIYHQALFAHLGLPIAVVNVGGIANVSFLMDKDTVSGYDIGPGNCLMDDWIFHHQGLAYDKDGHWAASGKPIHSLLAQCRSDSFFQQPCPRSIGKEYFSRAWLEHHCPGLNQFAPEDIQATLVQLTATTIADSILQQDGTLQRVLLCGGGAHNKTLLQIIRQQLPHIPVDSTAALRINPDFIEAQMFAWLAEKTINNQALDMNAITGAKRKAVLGVIYPAGIDKGISHDV